jgi:hypothetical protein
VTSRFPSLEFEICDMALTPAGDEGRHLCAPRRHAAATCCQPTTRRKPEYVPVSAAARAAAMDAAPSLETALDTFVQAHEVVMMHEARPQVAGGKNAQIEVRVAKLRAEWKGSPEELDIMRDVGIQGHISARASIRITSTCSWGQPGYYFPHLDPSPLSPFATFACANTPTAPQPQKGAPH